MITVITYGTFDLFHEGHLRLLQRAKALGDYLIVGVTTNHFDQERGKLNTQQDAVERIESVRQTGLADKIIIEEYRGQKVDDIQRFRVDIFAIGSDWDGKFDYLSKYCKVVYLPRTDGISSSQIRALHKTVDVGIIGTGTMASRFVQEAEGVSNIRISSVMNPIKEQASAFASHWRIPLYYDSLEAMFDNCTAVYIASPYNTHYDYVRQALLREKNVLCETPFVLKKSQAQELYALAHEKGLQLSVALKTAYCPAFNHLISMVESEIIGEVVEIEAATTTLVEETGLQQDIVSLGGSMIENACFPLLPAIKLLGTTPELVSFVSKVRDGVDIYTKGELKYPHSIATFKVGLGVKTEGEMTISGTKGYIYVPAPWWKTDYFEVRYEDLNRNKRFFYPYEGAGLRYEIKEFIRCILSREYTDIRLSPKEIIAMSAIHELFLSGEHTTQI